jgi:hypothetical protein
VRARGGETAGVRSWSTDRWRVAARFLIGAVVAMMIRGQRHDEGACVMARNAGAAGELRLRGNPVPVAVVAGISTKCQADRALVFLSTRFRLALPDALMVRQLLPMAACCSSASRVIVGP